MRWSTAIVGGVSVFSVWTLTASAAYSWLGGVPLHNWFYYAIPWPDDFLWDGLYLIVSGVLAAIPFGLAARMTRNKQQSGNLFGKTGLATPADMRRGGIEKSGCP